VHINSGIPNHAFYLAATSLGGNAWDKMGRIWYRTMQALNVTSNFADMVDMSTQSAAALFGPGSTEERAVTKAWKAVGF
jgi:Zn-dependent metalloprotease